MDIEASNTSPAPRTRWISRGAYGRELRTLNTATGTWSPVASVVDSSLTRKPTFNVYLNGTLVNSFTYAPADFDNAMSRAKALALSAFN